MLFASPDSLPSLPQEEPHHANLPFALTLLTLPVATAHAQAILVVPGTYPTIQAAISAAVNGDSVVVLPGVYPENIDVQGKDITIQSLNGAVETTIDGGMAGPTVLFSAGSSRAAIFEGFTVTGGNNTGGSPTSIGGGIRIVGSSPTVRDCVVRGNTSDSYGAGIGATTTPVGPLIERCTVVDNQATGLAYASGGGIAISAASPGTTATEIRHCMIADNSCTTRGGGIYLGYAPGCLVDGCRITRNITLGTTGNLDGGAGIFLALNSAAQVTNNRIWNNTSSSNGGGVKWFNVTGAAFVNNTIVGNIGGGAAAIANTASYGNNVVCDFVNCILWQNGAGPEFTFTGSDQNGRPPSANVDYSIVTGGYAGMSNLNVAPQLLNPDSGNHHLAPTSPCIDAGTSTLATLPAIDMDGDARVIGNNPDIGADEFDPNSPLLYSDIASMSVAMPTPINYGVTDGPVSGVFALFFSVSGTEPGTMLFGQTVPLNVDALTTALALVGVLDGMGNGGLTVPAPASLPPSLVGVTLSSAALTLGTAIDFSNDENVRFVP